MLSGCYREVEKVAGLASVMLRTGCFCNPGACAAHLGLSHEDVISNFEAGHVCWDDHDLIEGRPTGKLILLPLRKHSRLHRSVPSHPWQHALMAGSGKHCLLLLWWFVQTTRCQQMQKAVIKNAGKWLHGSLQVLCGCPLGTCQPSQMLKLWSGVALSLLKRLVNAPIPPC